MDITKEYIISALLEKDPKKVDALFKKAYSKKLATIGDKVYLRGLIEISNKCRKDCFYCGIRSGNSISRYDISDEEVISAARFAISSGYGSLVIQGGERSDKDFIKRISRLIMYIKEIESPDNKRLGITLSLGEQPIDVYKEWFDAGAHRYLLRIESSNAELYRKIHPSDNYHNYQDRLNALYNLKEAGYQVGTGVMIGLPFQNENHLAEDLLFFKEFDIDMCGMGPYLEHRETPLFQHREQLRPTEERLTLSLKMIALLRLIMPDINIAATTALQVISKEGRERAIMAGANIIMPNMTVSQVRKDYQIYENKPNINEDAAISKSMIEENLSKAKIPIGWHQWGDSIHFKKK